MRKLNFAILIVALAFMIDRYLPPRITKDVPVIGWQERMGKNHIISYMQSATTVYKVPNAMHVDYDYYAPEKKTIIIAITPIFRITKSYTVQSDSDQKVYSALRLPYVPLLMFIFSAFAVTQRKFSFLAYVCSFLPTILLIIQLMNYFF